MAQKPRLTKKIIRGIIAATSHANASPEDFIGMESSAWSDEDKKEWSDVTAADQWARRMREYCESKRREKPLRIKTREKPVVKYKGGWVDLELGQAGIIF